MEIGQGRSPEHRGRAERPSWSVSGEGGVCGGVETAWGDDGGEDRRQVGRFAPAWSLSILSFFKEKKNYFFGHTES